MGLPPLASVCFLFFLHISASVSLPQSILQYVPETNAFLSAYEFSVHSDITREDYLFCDSWRYSVEVDNLGNWTGIPSRCKEFVWEYMTGDRYRSDCEGVAYYALEYAKSVEVSKDDKGAWVFDVDETLISNVDFYLGNQSVYQLPPAIPSSLKLYNELRKRNFRVFLLTGREEPYRPLTLFILRNAGYRNWDRLIMRGPDDIDALAYKSKKRQELIDEGYALGERSFKMPNPMY